MPFPVLDFQLNYPLLGSEGEIFADYIRHLAPDQLAALMKPHPRTGRPSDREAGARFLAQLGLPVPAERVFLVSGGHHAVNVTLILTRLSGQPVAVDDLTYSNFLGLAARHNLRLLPCSGDADGMLPDTLEAAIAAGARAVYLMPTLHNPLGIVMSEHRRRALAAIAERAGVWIIEDDAYAFLEASPPPPVSGFAPERGFYILSLSKPFAPAIKTALLALPASFAADAEQTAFLSSSGTTLLFAAFVNHLLTTGTFAKLVAAKRDDGARRQALARTFINGCRITAHPASYHLWLEPERVPADDLVTRAQSRGLAISSGRSYCARPGLDPKAVRIALAGETDLARLTQGLEILRDLLRDC